MPLKGVRILDLTRMLPGPYATQLLGDFGADVVRVESPEGDLTARLPPFVGGESAAHLAINRNKRSIVVDLKKDAGRDAFLRLCASADVLVEPFRPGVAERLGIGYTDVASKNPQIIYCSISGFGRTGPYRDRAAHDLNYLALSGALSLQGPAGGPPSLPGVQAADLGGGLQAAIGILLALLARGRTGQGQRVDASLFDASWSLLSMHAGALFAGDPPRLGEGPLHGGLPNYGTYETRDGRAVALGALEPKFFEAFCSAAGRPDLMTLYGATGPGRDRLRRELEALFRSRDRDDWARLGADADCCLTPVLDLDEVPKDPHVAARGLVRDYPHPRLGTVKMQAVPIRLEKTPGALRRPAPRPGEHTDEVLGEAGFSAAEIATLRATGAVA